MSPLRAKVLQQMQLRRLAESTQKLHIGEIER